MKWTYFAIVFSFFLAFSSCVSEKQKQQPRKKASAVVNNKKPNTTSNTTTTSNVFLDEVRKKSLKKYSSIGLELPVKKVKELAELDVAYEKRARALKKANRWKGEKNDGVRNKLKSDRTQKRKDILKAQYIDFIKAISK